MTVYSATVMAEGKKPSFLKRILNVFHDENDKHNRKSVKDGKNDKKGKKCKDKSKKDNETQIKDSKDVLKDTKDDKKDTKDNKKDTQIQIEKLVEETRQTFKELRIKKQNERELERFTFTKKDDDHDEDDELANFEFKIIDDDRRSERIASESSGDSGFADRDDALQEREIEHGDSDRDADDVLPERDRKFEHREEKDGCIDEAASKKRTEDSLLDSLSKLKIAEDQRSRDEKSEEKELLEDAKSKNQSENKDQSPEDKEKDKEKRKKYHTVVVSRGPTRNKGVVERPGPYHLWEPGQGEQIVNHQINRQALSGGLVKVTTKPADMVPGTVIQFPPVSAGIGDRSKYDNQYQNENQLIESLLYENPLTNPDLNAIDFYDNDINTILDNVVSFDIETSRNGAINDGMLRNSLEVSTNKTELNSVVPSNVEELNNISKNVLEEFILKAVDDALTPQQKDLLTNDYIATYQEKFDSNNEFMNVSMGEDTLKEQCTFPNLENEFQTPPFCDLPAPSCLSNDGLNVNLNVSNSFEAIGVDATQKDQIQIITTNEFGDNLSNYSDSVPNMTQIEQNLPNYSKMADSNHLTQHLNEETPYLTPPYSNKSPLSYNSPYYSGSELTSPKFYSPGPSFSKSPEYNNNSPQTETLSPGTKSEKFQEIKPIENENDSSKTPPKENLARKTMPEYKRLQKQLSEDFEKRECCKRDDERKSCKILFKEYSEMLTLDERVQLNVYISNLDMNSVYSELHEAISVLSLTSVDREEIHYHSFFVLCHRMLSVPKDFIGVKGLCLLQETAMQCPHRPLLTRLVVECVYKAVESEKFEGKVVFDQRGEKGDTLLIRCAASPYRHSDVLAELVRRGDSAVPLFDIDHRNDDGYSALHTACRAHGPADSALHAVHVLLRHGRANLQLTDMKSGDTAVHLAVMSKGCDINLILVLFAMDMAKRNYLANLKNWSSVSPRLYASRKTHSDVYNFLSKCK